MTRLSTRKVVSNGLQFKQRAFSLLEVMVAIAILGIIAAVGAPAMGQFYDKQKVNVGVERISAALSLARSTALSELVDVKVCWNPGTSSTTQDGIAIEGGQLVVYKTNPAVLVSNITFNDQTFVDDSEGDNCVVFNTQGRIDLSSISGTKLEFGVCKESGEVDDSKYLSVSQTGRALTRPNVTSGGTALINCE